MIRLHSDLERNVSCVVGMEFGGQFLFLQEFLISFRRSALLKVQLNVQKSVFFVGGIMYFDVVRGPDDADAICECNFVNLVDIACVFESRTQSSCFVPSTISSGDVLLTYKSGNQVFF